MLASTLFATLALLGSASATVIPRQVSSKLGISWPVQEGDAAPVNAFFQPGSKVSWWYDWNMGWSNGPMPATPPGTQIGGDFVPMIWSVDFLNNLNLEPGFSTVFGFNEPDHDWSAVAQQMDPQNAAIKWREMVNTIRGINPNTQFASPAVASNREWLREFYGIICPGGLAGCDVAPQYTAVHSYNADANVLIADIQTYWDEFQLPLIITEFACTTFGAPPPSQDQVYQFMGQVTKWLDEQPFVHRYAWFGASRNPELLYGVSPENKLMDEAGNLTPLGQQYIAGGWA